MIDLRSWPKKWNDAALRNIVTLPEGSSPRPWPMLGMLALGLVAGAVIGGYAMSQRSPIKRLALYAHRPSDELDAMDRADTERPDAPVTAPRSNHRRKVDLTV